MRNPNLSLPVRRVSLRAINYYKILRDDDENTDNSFGVFKCIVVGYKEDIIMNSSPAHRRGMVFVDDEQEYDIDETYDSLRRFATEESGSSDQDSDYAEIDMTDNLSDESSFHSEGDEIAEYWDPYRESSQRRVMFIAS